MLRSLHISNYALIDHIDLEFGPRLNIITGETGGGKSIMLGALSLLLGGRADLRGVRNGTAKSVIEAVFDVKGNEVLEAYCKATDVEWDPEQMILRREILPSGRSRAFINDSPVTIETLRGVGLKLVDIHSQHQNQLLSDPSFQLDIIDTLAGNKEALAVFAELYAAYRAAVHKLKTMRMNVARDRENADFMHYQLQRLEELDLKPDELETLEQERERLSQAADTRREFDDALGALSQGEANVLSLLGTVAGAVASLAEQLPAESNVENRLEAAVIELTDIAQTLEKRAAMFPADSLAELESVEERMARINAVASRQNVADANELIAVADRLRQRLQRLEDADTLLADLEKQARKAKKAAVEAARKLSEARVAAAEEFGRVLHDTAMPLGMKNLVCDIAVEPADMSASGMDRVEFRFAFNKNQQPVPVGVAASGGEISRLMLSIKSIIANRMALPSIIFDEVDTGVSGDVADRMGRMMQSISANLQVIAITHLPQVAAKGHDHFKVFKHDTDAATVTHVEKLTPDQRVDEIALMLSGQSNNQAAREAAKELISYATI